ncbi:Chloride channel protein [Candidatus Rhodobacter oscarellae]|uniref:Chloride channel protein n=1 Tax=Candidatus Rhodobacter oscarellae TaxID=1675527 RepID=A0A0J9E142_9RHOB|nr:chloride channel protein [Candidatus Rhodobacter lobularis]KMW56407.1 Chloride channel protein [Candidatus Rhodobacter lobularis]
MPNPNQPERANPIQALTRTTREGWRVIKERGPGQVQFWFIALAIGIAAGTAALFFRMGIEALQAWIYGTEDILTLHSFAGTLPWYWLVLIPVCGGLTVGLILHWFTPTAKVEAVAEVIEGAALKDGRVDIKPGLAGALASFITLSTGGSSGREGPVVHIAAMLSSAVSNIIRADGITGRDLLGCAVAAAVSASFNAPIAGAIFALEVVLRHFAVHAFAPIVIASVAGTIINRLQFGGVTEFTLAGETMLKFYVELPAFLLLGLLCGLLAVVLMRSIFWADEVGTQLQEATGVPRYLRPAVAGLMLGVLAVFFPHIIGVGYETTSMALTGQLLLWQAVVYTVLKAVAVAITLGGRMGGGVFSPSLMLGAMAGLAFGLVATSVFPEVSGSVTLYALAGMGALAAAVLGAPISTTLIVFELTGDWQTGLAVMVAVSMSTALASRLVDRSFFLTQLERRNVRLAAGPQAYLLGMVRVATLLKPPVETGVATQAASWELIEQGVYIDGAKTLEEAMPIFDQGGAAFLPVVTLFEDRPPELLGVLYHVDALKAFNRALADTAAEEHS